MDNPYSPPQADVVAIDSSNSMDNFKRFSAWWVFLLTTFTFGIYTVYWFYTRSQTINDVHHHRVPEVAMWGSIILFVTNTAFSFVPGGSFANQNLFALVTSIAYLFFILWWIFAVRNRLQEMIDENGGADYRLGPVMTFFFQNIYLQYKINEQIDRQTQSIPAQSAIQESAG